MDMLVKLYDVVADPELDRRLKENGIVVRRALALEFDAIRAWILTHFSTGWASEAQASFYRDPCACLIAVRDGKLLGFACYDGATLGFFGPTGVAEAARGLGIGKALLIRTLLAMRERGYGYAAIGWVGPADFYAKTVGAVPIPESDGSVYKGMLDPLQPLA